MDVARERTKELRGKRDIGNEEERVCVQPITDLNHQKYKPIFFNSMDNFTRRRRTPGSITSPNLQQPNDDNVSERKVNTWRQKVKKWNQMVNDSGSVQKRNRNETILLALRMKVGFEMDEDENPPTPNLFKEPNT